MKILGIETSCDETAAAVTEDGEKLLSNVVASSVDLHVAYGGVVPEIAARSHLEHINPVIKKALHDAKLTWSEVDAIAVTQGPGLGGSLLVGVLTARTLAILNNKPLYAVNHVLAHPYAAFLETKPQFPILVLIISGGHSQIALFESHSKYTILGRTLDDAIGEAFDKVAKIIGLPYPGGPSIEHAAVKGDANKYNFPQAKMTNPYDFSFSGLKTAVLRAAQAEIGQDYTFPSHKIAERLSYSQRADIAASFQQVGLMTLVDKLAQAIEEFAPKSVIVAGGVAASRNLRQLIEKNLKNEVIYPDRKLCTDNAAMIAIRAYHQIKSGGEPSDPYSLEIAPSLSM